MQSVAVFVISLARAPDRRSTICKHLEALGIEYELVNAVDGSSLSDAEIAKRVASGRKLHRGAVGCYMSHIGVYETIVSRKLPVALVLEDDARVDRRAKDLINGGLASRDFDYCFLDSDPHNDRGPVFYDANSGICLADGIRAYELSAGPQTTHSYLISLEGAGRRLAHAYPIRKPIDMYDHLPYVPKFRAVVSPKLAWVGEHSLVSFTSTKSASPEMLRFSFLRKYPWFFRLRDRLLIRNLRRKLLIPRLVSQGRLDRGRNWHPLPEGRDILLS